jgi:hypothetical protein
MSSGAINDRVEQLLGQILQEHRRYAILRRIDEVLSMIEWFAIDFDPDASTALFVCRPERSNWVAKMREQFRLRGLKFWNLLSSEEGIVLQLDGSD